MGAKGPKPSWLLSNLRRSIWVWVSPSSGKARRRPLGLSGSAKVKGVVWHWESNRVFVLGEKDAPRARPAGLETCARLVGEPEDDELPQPARPMEIAHSRIRRARRTSEVRSTWVMDSAGRARNMRCLHQVFAGRIEKPDDIIGPDRAALRSAECLRRWRARLSRLGDTRFGQSRSACSECPGNELAK